MAYKPKKFAVETRRVKKRTTKNCTKQKKEKLSSCVIDEEAANDPFPDPNYKLHQFSFEEKDTVTTPLQRGFMCSGSTYISAQKELVNHPLHYGGENNPYEVIRVIEAWELNFNLGNTVKYIGRAGKKDDILKDLQKAAFYLNREIEKLKNV